MEYEKLQRKREKKRNKDVLKWEPDKSSYDTDKAEGEENGFFLLKKRIWGEGFG